MTVNFQSGLSQYVVLQSMRKKRSNKAVTGVRVLFFGL